MNYSPETRSTLLARVRNVVDGRLDEEAWDEFVGIYEPLIIRFVKRHGLQDSDALDACQQVMLGISQDIRGWQDDGRPASFRRWLFRVARNRVLKVIRQARRRPQTVGGSSAHDILQNVEARHSEIEFNQEYQQQILLWAASQIRGEFRTSTWNAFWDTCVLGRPILDVAGELGVSVGSVYVARSRIVARLREVVRDLEVDH